MEPVIAGMWHNFQDVAAIVHEAKPAIENAGGFVGKHLQIEGKE